LLQFELLRRIFLLGMNTIKYIFFLLFVLTLTAPSFSQENSNTPQRTPEQEAVKQTDKLQQELNLTPEQAKQVYEINLKYARERQISNTRSQAMERMKNKNSEIQQVLNDEQNNKLQTKRYEHSTFENQQGNPNQIPANSSTFRSPANARSNPVFRVPAQSDMNLRNNYRATRPDFQTGTQQNQNQQRNNTTSPRTTDTQNNQQQTRSGGGTPAPQRRTETASPPTNTNNSKQQSTPSPRRTETPSRTERK
jgi:hypothetical protein